MLTPDYQEFANRARGGRRDNTVICGFRTREAIEIRQALRDCHAKTSTKAELSGRKTPETTAAGWCAGAPGYYGAVMQPLTPT
jgi:hypothetical protein